jgi:hypothetical protein
MFPFHGLIWQFVQMNSMAIIYQLVSRCYQDPHLGKETLLKAATCTLKSLKQYLKEVALCGPVSGFVIQAKSSSCVRFDQIEESDISQHENIC